MSKDTLEPASAPSGEEAPPHLSPYEQAVRSVMAQLGAERALVVLCEGDQRSIPAACNFEVHQQRMDDLPISTHLVEEVLSTHELRYDADLQNNPDYRSRVSVILSQVRSLVCVPYWVEELDIKGVLYADAVAEGKVFTWEDTVKANHCARTLEDYLRRGGGPPPALVPKAQHGREPRAAATRPTEENSWTCRRERLAPFLRMFAVLWKSGVPVLRALRILGESEQDPGLKRILKTVESRVAQGCCLSVEFGKFPKAFPASLLAALRLGERSGQLVEVLEQTGHQYEQVQRTEQTIRGSLVYPTFLVAVTLLGLVVGLPLTMRHQVAFLQELRQPLPWVTRLVLTLGNPACILLALAALVLLGWRCRRWKNDPRVVARLLRMRLIGRLISSYSAYRFAQSLGLLLRVGFKFQDSLELAAQSTGNPLLLGSWKGAQEALEGGATLSQTLAHLESLPANFVRVVATAEEVGHLEKVLGQLECFYEMELTLALETYVSLLEPLVMLAVGCLVGFFLVASLLPMATLLQTL